MSPTLTKEEPEEVAFEEEYSAGTKCGIIFRTEDRKYTLICEFCEDAFHDMFQFGVHLEAKHFRNNFEHLENQQVKVEINDCPSMEKADTSQETYQEIKVEVEECAYDKAAVIQDGSLPESENLASLDKAHTITSRSEDPRFDDKNALCTTCDRRFSSKCSFRRHVRKHKKLPVKENEKIFCDLCNSIFRVPHLFRAHAISKHGNTIPKALQGDPTYLACFRCNQPFETPLERHEHEKMHKPEDPYVCPQCPKTYSDKRYRRTHIRTHDSIPRYSCPHCKVAFRQPHSLRAHVRLHQDLTPFSRESSSHSIINNDEKVDTKNDEFANQIKKEIDGCRPHKEVHPSQKTHEEIKVEIDDCDPTEQVNGSQETDEDINLGIDEYSYGEISVKQDESLPESTEHDRLLNEQIKMEINEELDKCLPENEAASCELSSSDNTERVPSDSLDEENLIQKPMKLDESKHNSLKKVIAEAVTEDFDIICEFCEIKFMLPYHFRAHVFSDHGNSIPKALQNVAAYLTCDWCNQRFETPLEIHAHEQLHNKLGDLYHCSICPKTFPSRTIRRSHILLHNGIRPYLCPHCPLTFRTRRYLLGHVRLHLQKPQFPCNTCGKRFRTAQQRKEHVSIHTNEKPHRCAECGAQFRLMSSLRVHLKHHSDKRHKCEQCGVEFITANRLKYHLAKHSDDRPFQCSQEGCGSTFKWRSSLRQHLKKHEMVKSHDVK